MTTRVDTEDIQTTRSEKVLAVVLAVFISIGAIWAYDRLGEVAEPDGASLFALEQSEPALIADNQASRELAAADRAVRRAEAQVQRTEDELRTAADIGRPTAELEVAYDAAQAESDAARAARGAAEAAAAKTRPAADAVRDRVTSERDDDQRSHDRIVFALRLLFAGLMLGAAYLLMGRMRRTRSRYFVASISLVGAATVVVLVMATDYATDYIDVGEVGPLALSLTGIVLTLAAFTGLQRYLAKRLPARRVRRRECPFCGYDVRENSNCEGCGRRVIGKCSACSKARRVGTRHCGACGAA